MRKAWFSTRIQLWQAFESGVWGLPRKWFTEFLFTKEELTGGMHFVEGK